MPTRTERLAESTNRSGRVIFLSERVNRLLLVATQPAQAHSFISFTLGNQSNTTSQPASQPVTMGKGGDAKKPIAGGGATSPTAPTKYTWADVQQHRTPDDAWVVYHNKVYDVSNWHEHPGGAVIFTHAGDDMTDIFAAFHAGGSHNLMAKFYIGDLIPESNTNKTPQQIAFEKGYRDLRSQLVVMGMFKSNPYYYAYKCTSNLAIWATGMILMYQSDSVWVHCAAALLLGLFFQQCGWLAHDFLHHQVFRKRKYGDLAGIFWGNLAQGCK